MNKTELLLEKGFIDVLCLALKAFELQGVSKVDESPGNGMFCAVHLFNTLDFAAPEAAPIMRMLEDMPSTLRFLLEHSRSHLKDIGATSAAAASAVCALAFGKQEGDFAFTQQMIEDVVKNMVDNLSGVLAAWNPILPTFFLLKVVHLCISDANKNLLLESADLCKLLLEALLLDPEHMRQTQSEDVKAAIQRDAAECFMQLALFAPGRDLLKQDTSVLEALHMLVDKAWTDEAKQCAKGALMALVPPQEHSPRSGNSVDSLRPPVQKSHVMVSYSWCYQAVVQRVVTALKHRGYLVWFDLERMQGSVIVRRTEPAPSMRSNLRLIVLCRGRR